MDILEKYKAPILKKVGIENWKEVPIEESLEIMVKLNNISDKIKIEPVYFNQGRKGSIKESYVRKTLADKLIKASENLPKGYAFLIWDAYRPLEVQQDLFDDYYEVLKKDNPNLSKEELMNLTQKFVSLPSTDRKKPSPHNTGAAIDLTICDENGVSIKMGGGFDDFTERANERYYEEKLEKGTLKDEEYEFLINRRILNNLLIEQGFLGHPYEWWHKCYKDQMYTKMSMQEKAIYGMTQI